jgi:hypothetical protein
MTAYKFDVPGVAVATTLTRSLAALEAKKRRKAQLEEIQRRRRENSKRFLAHKLACLSGIKR